MKKIPLLVVLCCLMIAPATALVAQDVPPPAPPMQGPPPQGPRPMPMGGIDMAFPAPCLMSSLHMINQGAMPMLSARLQLTEEQKTSVGELLKQADIALKLRIDQQRKAGEKYVDLLLKNDTSEPVLLGAAEEAMKAEAAIVAEKIKTLQALRALLNDEQKASMNSMLAQFAAPWKMKPMGPRPGPRPGEPNPPVPPAATP